MVDIKAAVTSNSAMACAAGCEAEFRCTREMGISRGEFFRTLPGALGERTYGVAGDQVTIEEPHRMLVISLAPQPDRIIGSLRLPSAKVDFRFNGYSPADRESFMARFDLYFRRGGG